MNKTILITGAAGSVAQEIMHGLGSDAIYVLLDRDEYGLFSLKSKLENRAGVFYELADIRDKRRISSLFQKYSIDVIIHAAAYKQLPILEDFPYEAYDNNSLATMNLLDWAVEAKVSEFIYISTDKAVNPSSCLGRSKRLGELYLMYDKSPILKKIIRFGNLIGSRGAVLEAFQNQIKLKGFIELTHQFMERFILSPEALKNAMNELLYVENSGLFVVKMGNPERIIKYAQEALASFDVDINKIKVVGLRKGEKIQEKLFHLFEIPVDDYNTFTGYKSKKEFKLNWSELKELSPENVENFDRYVRMITEKK